MFPPSELKLHWRGEKEVEARHLHHFESLSYTGLKEFLEENFKGKRGFEVTAMTRKRKAIKNRATAAMMRRKRKHIENRIKATMMTQKRKAIANHTKADDVHEPREENTELAQGPWGLPDDLCEKCQQLQLSLSAPARGITEIDFRSLDPPSKHGHLPSRQARNLQMKPISWPFCRLVLMAYTHSGWNHGQMILKWTDNSGFHFSYDGERLVYIQSHADADAPLSPHEIGRVISPEIDPELIRSWLVTCEERHARDSASFCAPQTVNLQLPDVPLGLKCLRLIDVERQRLVEATAVNGGRCPRYVTLSYLWGGVQPVLLKRETFQDFSRDGGLAPTAVALPQTIADAIALVARIGERYLWVDSLCIVQDDDEDKADNIKKMDLIYQGGVLNIVAAAGTGSNAGLPGLWTGSRQIIQHIEEVLPGVFMTHVSCLFSILCSVNYMKRGWTFQEFILSPRNLIFLDNCVYFLCGNGVWSEDTVYHAYPDTRNGNTGTSQDVTRLTTRDTDTWLTFSSVLFRYTQRELSFRADYLDAMTGILNRFCSDTGAGHLAGLPLKYFDLALLQWTYAGSRERLEQIPSWSWAGWFGYAQVFVPQADGTPSEEWLTENTYIVWYVRDSDKTPRKVFGEDPHKFGREEGRRPENGKSGEFEHAKERGNEGHRGREKASLYGQRPPPVPLCVRPENYKPAKYPTEPTMLFSSISSAILQFWAQTIVLSLQPRSDFAETNTDFTAVHGNHCQNCGSVRIDMELYARRINKRTVNAVILSAAERSYLGGYPGGSKPSGPFYWILIIEWTGTIAERKGLGFVYQDCIAAAEPSDVVWREIALT